MSGTTVFGIVITTVCVVGIAVVGALFVWGAREDGRDQERTNARLGGDSRNGPRELP
jgi:hypothetical protein